MSPWSLKSRGISIILAVNLGCTPLFAIDPVSAVSEVAPTVLAQVPTADVAGQSQQLIEKAAWWQQTIQSLKNAPVATLMNGGTFLLVSQITMMALKLFPAIHAYGKLKLTNKATELASNLGKSLNRAIHEFEPALEKLWAASKAMERDQEMLLAPPKTKNNQKYLELLPHLQNRFKKLNPSQIAGLS